MRVGWIVWLGVAVVACQAPVRQVASPAPSVEPAIAASVSPEPTIAAAPAPATNVAPASAHHCEGSPALCGQNAAPPMPQAAAGGQRYGAAFDAAVPLTPLSQLLANPLQYATKVVRTRGVIGRVCQHRGCWMELRAEDNAQVVRVPMAGHAFFVPSDSAGRPATIQGVVSVREGTESPVRIDATTVLIADATASAVSSTRSN